MLRDGGQPQRGRRARGRAADGSGRGCRPSANKLHAVLDLVEHCGRAYVLSDEAGRRDYNQAWFEAIYLDADDEDRRPTVTRVRRTPLLASLHERVSQDWPRRSPRNNNAAEARARRH